MTTIAADLKSGVMACDSQWSDGANKGQTRKVYRIKGQLIGFAGDTKSIENAREWFKSGRKGVPPRGDVAALILGQTLATWEPQNGFVDQGSQFAIGSGGGEARACMYGGIDVSKAVWCACKVDAQSGGPVRTYRLK